MPALDQPSLRATASLTAGACDDVEEDSSGSVLPQSLETESVPVAVTWKQQLWDWLNGEEGASAALSFVFHAILLALLAIPVIHQLRSGPQFVTTVTESTDEPVLISNSVDLDTALTLPDDLDAGTAATDQILTALDSTLDQSINMAAFNDQTVAKGTEDGAVAAGRIKAPKNAVKAGSFTVFTLPKTRFGEKAVPGQSPRPNQDYFIVIQVAMPTNRTVYPLRDLSGVIIGTDGYRQKIPQGAFVLNDQDQMTPAPQTRSIEVIDDHVQVFILVPGADRLVQDRIHVASRLLRESQDLEIQFE
ncbi:MAG: hypothetical protein KDA58_03595 [Planctomycetaceae bacterium]|nr:hypothetical protein [Planctomycetaceae bacterium]